MLIEKKINKISPRYASTYEGMLKKYAQFGGGSANDQLIMGRYFSNVYEMYMYSYFLGVRIGEKYDISPDLKMQKFWEIENWKPRELVDQLLAVAIARSDFDMTRVELLDESEANDEVMKIRIEIEEFANAGLRYIESQIDDDPDAADSNEFFVSMLINSG